MFMFYFFLILPNFRVYTNMHLTLKEFIDQAVELGEDAPVIRHHDVGKKLSRGSFL